MARVPLHVFELRLERIKKTAEWVEASENSEDAAFRLKELSMLVQNTREALGETSNGRAILKLQSYEGYLEGL